MPKGREEEYFDWPVHDASARGETPTTSYKEGGSIYARNEAKRKAIKEAGEKVAAENRKKAEARKAKRAVRKAARKTKRAAKKEAKKYQKDIKKL